MWRRDEHLFAGTDLKMSKSHANVVSFDKKVSYLSTSDYMSKRYETVIELTGQT